MGQDPKPVYHMGARHLTEPVPLLLKVTLAGGRDQERTQALSPGMLMWDAAIQTTGPDIGA